jgi:stage V sporulation protein K
MVTGGVLFIDEAYALFAGTKPSNDFGMRIIDSLMTVLSDPKSETLVVLAGYEDKMKELLDANPGLASRFPVHLHFPDYTVDELMLMAESWFTENKYKANAQVMQRIRDVIEKVINEKGFGAGRFIHTFIENTILPNMATRLYARVPLVEYDNKVLARILPEDVPEPGEILANIKGPEKKVRAIGFH